MVNIAEVIKIEHDLTELVSNVWSKVLLLHSRHIKSMSKVRNSACSVLHGSGHCTMSIGWSLGRGGPWNRPTVPISSGYVLLPVLICVWCRIVCQHVQDCESFSVTVVSAHLMLLERIITKCRSVSLPVCLSHSWATTTGFKISK